MRRREREEAQKASVNQRQHRMLHSKHQLENIQGVRSIYTACCLCGWTEQRANQMCYLYGVKARLLTEYVRNLSLTLNLTFMPPRHLMMSYLWSDLQAFEGHVKGAEGRMNPHEHTVMYQGEIYYDATEDDCLAALPIHDEYPHNIKFYTPVAKCVPFVFSFLRSLDSK